MCLNLTTFLRGARAWAIDISRIIVVTALLTWDDIDGVMLGQFSLKVATTYRRAIIITIVQVAIFREQELLHWLANIRHLCFVIHVCNDSFVTELIESDFIGEFDITQGPSLIFCELTGCVLSSELLINFFLLTVRQWLVILDLHLDIEN